MNQKEKWIEDQMNAESFIEHVPPSEELMNRLRAIPSQVKTTYDTVPKKVVWAVAASIAILLFVNVISFSNYKTSNTETTSQNEVSDSYFSYLKQL